MKLLQKIRLLIKQIHQEVLNEEYWDYHCMFPDKEKGTTMRKRLYVVCIREKLDKEYYKSGVENRRDKQC